MLYPIELLAPSIKNNYQFILVFIIKDNIRFVNNAIIIYLEPLINYLVCDDFFNARRLKILINPPQVTPALSMEIYRPHSSLIHTMFASLQHPDLNIRHMLH